MTGKSDFYKLDTEEAKKTCENNHVLNKYTESDENRYWCEICRHPFYYKDGYYNCK